MKNLSVADPGSGAFFTPGSGMGKKRGSGSGMNNPDRSPIFSVKMLKLFFDTDPGSGVEKIRINIPDTQHCTIQHPFKHFYIFIV